jgi:hypothetical protein
MDPRECLVKFRESQAMTPSKRLASMDTFWIGFAEATTFQSTQRDANGYRFRFMLGKPLALAFFARK